MWCSFRINLILLVVGVFPRGALHEIVGPCAMWYVGCSVITSIQTTKRKAAGAFRSGGARHL